MKHKRRAGAILSASPNPIPGTDPRGESTVSWSTGSNATGQVFVSESGGPEILFATGRRGTKETDGIAPGIPYRFRLYKGTDRAVRLASVTVSRDPNPWETVASGLLVFSRREEYWDDVAEVLGEVIPRLILSGRRAKYFHLWEERGFHVTPVHYYYPIPDTRQLPDRLWNVQPAMPGIDMNDEAQLDLLQRDFPVFKEEYEQFPMEPTGRPHEFYFNNAWFGGTDALVLYCMVRHFRPRLVLEIGSGFSTRVALKAALKNGNTRLICIEPYPDDPVRHGVLDDDQQQLISFLRRKVEDIDLDLFLELSAGDIVFVDSSHVSRIGGDVNRVILDVLPRLNPGVIVHFHDIFLPWEYPRDWVADKLRFFTEQYLLQAFLTFNSHYSVLMANHYLGRRYQRELRTTFPNSPRWGGESFWIRRRAL